MNTIQIFAIDRKTGEKDEITDLYWFEEQMVHGWDGDGHGYYYDFEIVIDAGIRREYKIINGILQDEIGT